MKKFLNKKAQRKNCDALGIYIIDTLVLDTRYTSYMCNDMQRLKSKRKLTKGEVELRMQNCSRVIVVMLKVVKPKLSYGDSLCSEECHYIGSIVKNIIFISFLDKMSYVTR